jgi:hypothetical protein
MDDAALPSEKPLQSEVTRMRSKLFTAWAVLIVVAWQGADARSDDLGYSNFDVRLAAIERDGSSGSGAVRAAFLSEETQPRQLRIASRHKWEGGFLRQGIGGANCETCGRGEAWSYGPDGDCGMPVECGSSCSCGASCDCGASCNCGPECNCSTQCDCGSGCECDGDDLCCSEFETIRKRLIYGEVQVMWLRTHIMEDAAGKLSEHYKFSPRLIVGYEDPSGIGARLRYWHYDHLTEFLGDFEGINFAFDVADAEITSRYTFHKTDLVVAGGLRWADIEIEVDDDTVSSGMPGLTFAADLRTHLCGSCDRQWAGIAGARWSILGGDWEGSSSGFVPAVRDDNVVVQELYGGVEYMCCTRRGHTLFARLVLELQNWHSDAAAQLAGTDSIGFVGPGVHIGGAF